NLAQFEDKPFSERGFPPFGHLYPQMTFIAPQSFRAHKDTQPDQWREDIAYGVEQRLSGRQTIEETVTSGYLLGNTQIGRFSVLGGFRVEQTEVEGEGPLHQITDEEAARRDAWEGPV